MFDDAPVMQENDVVCQPARLTYVMGDDNDLDASPLRLNQQSFDE